MNIFDIPIITYHKISSQKEFGLTTITPQTFRNQMQLIADKGFQSITFNQIETSQDLPEKLIVINFDDTYKSVYDNAFPIMKEFGFKGVLFVVSDYIGKRNDWEAYPIQRQHYHANKEEISEMLQYGFEIGSHCKTHQFLPHLSREDIKSELQESKQFLENIFKTEIVTCCYPYGGCSDKVVGIAKSLDYKYGTGNIKFLSNNTNPLCLQRRSIYSSDLLSVFYDKITTTSKLYYNFISEWIIQKGAYAGIFKNKYL
jgi:peptidoglycan/xylan/chitin deacetylase (PgdA/CDA1 family)